MITQQEWILMHLLDCGQCDLSLLNDIKYDIDYILDNLMESDSLSLNNILREVFINGIMELKYKIDNEKQDVIDDLKYLNKILPKSYESEIIIQQKENALNESDIYLADQLYHIEWGDCIEEHIREIELLNPLRDIMYYTNCLDSSIYFVQHEEIYRRYFASEIKTVEANMGFEF